MLYEIEMAAKGHTKAVKQHGCKRAHEGCHTAVKACQIALKGCQRASNGGQIAVKQKLLSYFLEVQKIGFIHVVWHTILL